MSEGDKITCKCGKKIKIKGGKKTAAQDGQGSVDDALKKRAILADDVEVIDKN
jgi:hypothetical protein